MVENLGKIISNGFSTYTKNINISIPFILNFFLTILLVILVIAIGFLGVFGSSLMNLENIKTPEEVVSVLSPIIEQHILELIIIVLTAILVVFFIQAYFVSGAIGMAIQATESGRSDMYAMRNAGKKNFKNMFLAEILFSLLSLAGIVFIVPGAMRIQVSGLLTSDNSEAFGLLFGGFFIWIIYLVILSVLLAVFRYALVADNKGPWESMTGSLDFFKQNKMDVFLLFLIVISLSSGFVVFDLIMRSIPIINIIWPIINFIISLMVIPPLTTIWWVRLYMARTNRKLYFDDLLAHPNELSGIKYG